MDGLAALALIFWSSLILGFTGALMPGPLLTVDISESAKKGFRSGPLLVVGHGIVEGLVVVGLAFGLNQLIQESAIKGFVGIVGGGFLVWMGYGIVKAAYRGEVSLKVGDNAGTMTSGPILSGALVSLSNPYWVLWWATAGAAYVFVALERGAAGLVSFYSGHILSDLIWYSTVALVISKGKSLLSDSIYRGILMVCGVFLWFLSLYFIYTGIEVFTGRLA